MSVTASTALRTIAMGIFAVLAATHTVVHAEEAPAIAAAASLRYALDEIAKGFEKETGKSVKITYGATGNLVHQIEASAPFQALLAADDESVNKLAKGLPRAIQSSLRAGSSPSLLRRIPRLLSTPTSRGSKRHLLPAR
jgi:ABC-type molybdate transport system substrate-binding protein